ncbi:YraN family protein [Streptomyces chrestomyceticus]|uniref:YraN family protein n=1 Tax=Streptomyces chrestomyceticus TaxID=68185 RepID=UPI003F4CC9AE
MRILDRNWRCQEGEVDIVAADKQDVLHQMQHCARRLHRRFGRWQGRRGSHPGNASKLLTCRLAR